MDVGFEAYSDDIQSQELINFGITTFDNLALKPIVVYLFKYCFLFIDLLSNLYFPYLSAFRNYLYQLPLRRRP